MKSKPESRVQPPAKKKKRSPSESKKAKRKKKASPQKMEEEDSESDENSREENAEFGETVESKENVKSEESNINEGAWSRLGVPAVIIDALRDQNFESPTEIQTLTLAPAIFGRRDILGAAETGSGKTLAFGIPILNGILELKKKEKKNVSSKSGNFQESNSEDIDDVDEIEEEDEDIEEEIQGKGGKINRKIFKMSKKIEIDDEDSDFEDTEEMGIGCVRVIDNLKNTDVFEDLRKPLYALILTPTRELAIQIKNHLTKAAKYTDIKIAVVLGGMAAVKQERILSKGPEIVIATPGRLWELVSDGNPHLSQLDSIKYIILIFLIYLH